jgi:hypothetical protein
MRRIHTQPDVTRVAYVHANGSFLAMLKNQEALLAEVMRRLLRWNLP